MAVDLQGRRAADSSQCFTDRLIDAVMFASALRNMLRAVSFAAGQMPNHAYACRVRAAVVRFNKRVPKAQQVRDALEHFDEYEQGKGKTQKGRKWPFKIAWQNESTGVLTVGPGLSLDVADARQAAMRLHLEFEKAILS